MAITAAGSGSGIDMESIISGLMSVERQPLTKLQSQQSTLNTQISDLGKLKSDLSALQTAGQKISGLDFLQANKASSSDTTSVGISTDSTAAPGTYQISVTSLAKAQTSVYSGLPAAYSATMDTGLRGTITVGSASINLGTSGPVSLNDLSNQINGQTGTTGISATVSTDPSSGQARLTLSGTGITSSSVSGLGALGTPSSTSGQLVFTPSLKNAPAGLAAGSISVNGKSITLTGSETFSQLTDKINGASAGVTATLLPNGASYKLVLAGSQTGASQGAFTVSGLDALGTTAGGTLQTTAAGDAQYSLNGISATSSSNTISDVINGVSFTLQKEQSSATLSIASDNDAIANKVQSFVDAYNKVMADTKSLGSGSFKGDGMLRSVTDQLYAQIYAPVDKTSSTHALTDYAPLTAFGITLGADNKLSFDKTKFTAALTANSANVQAAFVSNIGTLATNVGSMLDSQGLVGGRQSVLDSRVKDNQDRQSVMQDQLTAKEKALRAQYGALDSALTNMQTSLKKMKSMLGLS
ncbi:MAG TPA: flagellar filament capping protein FliD [Pseudogulbenkiania sp.]|nr:flagellar filament capping protein FliD [Pseudogulbenkiania sp.]